jgi:hypothetical protein
VTAFPRRAVVAIAAAALVPLALASCAAPRAGAAAYVGDDRIMVEDVQDATAEIVAAAERLDTVEGLDTTEINRRAVNRFVNERLVLEAAERAQLTVSDAEAAALLDEAVAGGDLAAFADQIAVSQLVPPSQLDAFVRTVALNQKLLQVLAPGADEAAQNSAVVEALGALSTELGTGVSPRYGTWDPTDLSVTLPENDLSTPEPLPTSIISGTTGAE